MQTLTDDITALESALNSSGTTATPTQPDPIVDKDDIVNITVGDWRLADIEYINGGYIRGRAEVFN